MISIAVDFKQNPREIAKSDIASKKVNLYFWTNFVQLKLHTNNLISNNSQAIVWDLKVFTIDPKYKLNFSFRFFCKSVI